MKLSEIKKQLSTLDNVALYCKWNLCTRTFSRNRSGLLTRNFIDCGKVWKETVVNFSVWMPMTLNTAQNLKIRWYNWIIWESIRYWRLWGGSWISSFVIKIRHWFNGTAFTLLINKQPCLAVKITVEFQQKTKKWSYPNLSQTNNTCTPGGGCY
jgi:hypothetical protein